MGNIKTAILVAYGFLILCSKLLRFDVLDARNSKAQWHDLV